jgi:dihydroorotase
MKILIKQARIVDPLSPLHYQITDLLIENGNFIEAGKNSEIERVIDIPGIHISPGWVDIFSNFADPGYEYKETIETGSKAAAAGGYTDVFIIPNTNPVIHNKSGVEYVIRKSGDNPVTIHPIGAITKNNEGKELAEMYDMKNSGAIAFSDGIYSLQSAGMLVKALQYIKAFSGIIIQLPDDRGFNPEGVMNEGIVSTRLGLPGKPAIAEELIIARDSRLAGYAGSRIHFTGISSAGSVEQIRAAKKQGIAVSCSVTPHHLYFSDEDLVNYDTNLKSNPPLRTNADREALKKAIADEEIDCIATHHLPHEYDSKTVEFEYAKHGMIGLSTSYAVLNSSIPGLPQEKWISLLSLNPRKIFGLDPATINIGNRACITLFHPEKSWTVSQDDLLSKSSNSPFLGKTLKGKPVGIINGDQYYFNAEF